jgi:hypothetical protein
MVGNDNKALKILLWIVAVYHIGLGLLGIFAKDFAVTLAKNFFNFNLTLTDQIYWIINPLAAYILVFGIFMALAAKDPSKYKNVIFVGVALFAVRVIQRLVFFVTAPEGLVNNIDPTKNIIMLVVVAAIGIAMFVMAKKVK